MIEWRSRASLRAVSMQIVYVSISIPTCVYVCVFIWIDADTYMDTYKIIYVCICTIIHIYDWMEVTREYCLWAVSARTGLYLYHYECIYVNGNACVSTLVCVWVRASEYIYVYVHIWGHYQRFYSTPEFENISPCHIINWWVHRSCVWSNIYTKINKKVQTVGFQICERRKLRRKRLWCRRAAVVVVNGLLYVCIYTYL